MRALIVFLLFTIPVASSAQYFTDVAQESGISFITDPVSMMGGGAAWFDFDNDGWEDLYITGSTLMDRLYRNLGDGLFENVSMNAGLFETANVNTMGVVIGDYNNDGWRDIFLTTWRELNGPAYSRCLLYRNEGDGTFTEVSEDAGITEPTYTMAAAFFDMNLDGWLDLYVGNYVATPDFIIEDGQPVGFAHTCFQDRFYLNNQDGTFSEMSESLEIDNDGCTLAVVASDYDLDGDQDLMVGNDFGEWVEPNKLYQNEYPSQEFTDVSTTSASDIGIYSMGIAVGDYDEDQDLDYYITNLGRNVLLNNDGGVFEDVTTEANVENDGANELLYTSWATFFLDYDNDSWLDLFVCNGHISTIDVLDNHNFDPNQLYSNNQDGTFEDITEESGLGSGQMARGSAMADYDKDGDLDIAIVNIDNNVLNLDEPFALFQNNADQGNWVAYDLVGISCNLDAVGALITLHADGRTFLQELTGGGGPHNSQNSSKIHFGLGEIEAVDSVFVQWPGGELERYDSDINDCFVLEQGLGLSAEAPSRDSYFRLFPIPATEELNVLQAELISGTYQIIGASGAMHQHGIVPQSPHWQLNISELAPGYYTLVLLGDQGKVTRRNFIRE
jgi:hypothetical protein